MTSSRLGNSTTQSSREPPPGSLDGGHARAAPNKVIFTLSLVLAVTGILFALAAPVDLVTKGPFGWHIRQPAFWQGGIELAVLAMLIGLALYTLQGWKRGLVVLVLCEIYARNQGTDLAILISLFYYEGMAALGTLILNRLDRNDFSDAERGMFGIALGILTWSCIEWILSAIGPGSVRDLQITALVVLGASLLALRRTPVLACIFSHVGKRSLSGAVLGTFVFTIVLMLFAKASVNLIDFDAMWYGLRGDRVLVAAGSVFHGLGLVTAVHYVPQAYELLQIPLNRTGSVTAILGLSIWCWVGLAICLYAITERLRWSPKLRLWACALCLTIPAAMNVSITAKGTLMAGMWVLFGVYALIRYRASPSWRWLVLALLFELAATTYRESILIYAVLAALTVCVFLVANTLRQPHPVSGAGGVPSLQLLICLGLGSVLLFGLVTARTFLLTGLPYYGPATLMRIAEHFGLTLRFPVGGPAPVHLTFNRHFPHLLFDYIFRPGNLWHVRIEWTGAAFAYLLTAGFAARICEKRRLPYVPALWVLALAFPALLLFFKYLYPGGDGNYFALPAISATLIGVAMLERQFSKKDMLGRTLNAVAGFFVVSMVAVSLLTGLWGPGIRAWDLNFHRPPLDFAKRSKAGLATANLQAINAYFRGFPSATRVTGIVPFEQSNDMPAAWLPVRYESMRYIQAYAPNYLHSVSTTEAFLRLDGIQYVFLPRNIKPSDPVYGLSKMTESAVQDLERRGLAVSVLRGDHYILWKLKY